MIEIMNLRNTKPTKPYDVYIDRRSPLGNPFYLVNEAQRDIVCEQYQRYFNSQISADTITTFIAKLHKYRDIYREYGKLRLFCWCAPKRCHGETIKKWLEENNN